MPHPDMITLFWGGMVECRVCSHRQYSVIPFYYPADEVLSDGEGQLVTLIGDGPELPDMECANCGNMSCEPVDATEEEGREHNGDHGVGD